MEADVFHMQYQHLSRPSKTQDKQMQPYPIEACLELDFPNDHILGPPLPSNPSLFSNPICGTVTLTLPHSPESVDGIVVEFYGLVRGSKAYFEEFVSKRGIGDIKIDFEEVVSHARVVVSVGQQSWTAGQCTLPFAIYLPSTTSSPLTFKSRSTQSSATISYHLRATIASLSIESPSYLINPRPTPLVTPIESTYTIPLNLIKSDSLILKLRAPRNTYVPSDTIVFDMHLFANTYTPPYGISFCLIRTVNIHHQMVHKNLKSVIVTCPDAYQTKVARIRFPVRPHDIPSIGSERFPIGTVHIEYLIVAGVVNRQGEKRKGVAFKVNVCVAASDVDYIVPFGVKDIEADEHCALSVYSSVPPHGFRAVRGAGRHAWVKAVDGMVPGNAWKVGMDTSGLEFYCARACVGGGLLIGRVCQFGQCFVGYNGKEVQVGEYEVLTVPGSEEGYWGWREVVNGKVPADAVVCGFTKTGKEVFVGQCRVRGGGRTAAICPGWVEESTSRCVVGYGATMVQVPKFSVLVLMGGPNRKLAHGLAPPAYAPSPPAYETSLSEPRRPQFWQRLRRRAASIGSS